VCVLSGLYSLGCCKRDFYQLSDCSSFYFGHYVSTMGFYGLDTNIQIICDLFVKPTCGYPL